MSKFTYSKFYGGGDTYFVVSKEKYTKEQAIELAMSELVTSKDVGLYLAVENLYVTHRAGVDEEGTPIVTWWLESWKRPKRSVPVWMFEIVYRHITDMNKGEYILIRAAKGERA